MRPKDITGGRSAGTAENPSRDPTRGRSAGRPDNPLLDPTRSRSADGAPRDDVTQDPRRGVNVPGHDPL